MKPILYLITYDAAIERKESYATEICAVFTTCDKQKADAACYAVWKCVDRWKPLGLPTDVNERVMEEIDKWFEEDE